MLRWAWKSLITQWASLISSTLGIASAFLLVIFFDAVFRGESTQIVAYIRHTKPDVWVMQNGVTNMHMASSFLWDWKAEKIATLPGVKQATPILYLNSPVHIGNRAWFSYIVGLTPQSTRGGPWKMHSGNAQPASGEAIIPSVIAEKMGLKLGDAIRITDHTLNVVGISEETFSMANSITFVSFDDLEDIISVSNTVSYVLVDAEPGVDPTALAQQIMHAVDKINAVPHDAFIESDFGMAMKMGVEIIALMSLIGAVLAGLLIAYTCFSLIVNKRRDLAIAKAVGMPNRALYVAVILQALIITEVGFAIAVICSFSLLPLINMLMPQVTLLVSADALIKTGGIAIAVAIVGSLIPAYRIARLEPAAVFKG